MKRLMLAIVSVAKLQEAVLTTLEIKYIPAISTIPATTVLALAPVPKQYYDELEEKILTPMKLAEFIDNKLAG